MHIDDILIILGLIAWLKYLKKFQVLTRIFSCLFMCQNESNNVKS